MQGSVINRIMENTTGTPYVGMPVTICHWSDRSVGIVAEVSPSGRQIKIAPVKAERTDKGGMTESQSYAYLGIEGFTDNPAHWGTWTLRKNGTYRRQGEPMRGSAGLVLGRWDAYYDYSF